MAIDPDVPTATDEPGGSNPEATIDEVDRLLDAVEKALAALDDGTYGQCATCGSAIHPSRLAEDPLAGACGTCSPKPSSVSEPFGGPS